MKSLKYRNVIEKYFPEIIGLLVFISYMFTVSHSVGENDAGELAMAQATLGIPHPTGYPLFILLGFMFSKLPIPVSPVLKLNILGSVWCALTVIIIIRVSALILNNPNLFFKNKKVSSITFHNIKGYKIIAASIFTGLMYAYSATFWLQSARVEVYSLQMFLSSLIIYLTFKTYIKCQENTDDLVESMYIIKKWWVIFFLLGLGFANHMMTLYLIPATVVLYFFSSGINFKSVKSLFVLFLITGLISAFFYFLLMIRANTLPPGEYWDVSTLKGLFEHITAKEYSKYLTQNTDTIFNQGSKLFKMLSFNFSSVSFSAGEFALSLFLGISGLFLIFLFDKKIIFYFGLILILSIIAALIYNIPDINEYFLIPFMIISILASIPLIIILKAIENRKLIIVVFYTFLLFLLIIEFKINYNYVDRSNTYTFEKTFKAAVNSLPLNSVLLTDNWILFLSPGFYYQKVENIRKDVSIISPSAALEEESYKIYKAQGILDNNNNVIRKNNIYISADVVFNLVNKKFILLPPKSILVPCIYFYRLEFDDKYYPLESNDIHLTMTRNSNDEFETYIRNYLAFMLEQRIYYEINYNKIKNAADLYNKLKEINNNYKISATTYLVLVKNGIIQ